MVIGIIGVLLGILLPTLQKARQAAMEAMCMSNLKQMGIGFQTYSDANHGWLPTKGPKGCDTGSDLIAPQTGSAPPVIGINDTSIWYNAIPPLTQGKSYYNMILADPKAILNPAVNPRPATWGNEPLPTHGKDSIFVCPMGGAPGTLDPWTGNTGAGDEISPDSDYFVVHGISSQDIPKTKLAPYGSFECYMSYVYNSQLFGTTNDGVDHEKWKMSMLRPAGSVILLVEKLANPSEYKAAIVQNYLKTPNAFMLAGGVTTAGYIGEITQLDCNWKRFTTRHRGGGMILFADGHVAWFSWLDVQPPYNQANPAIINGNQPDQGLIWNPLGGVGTKNTSTE